MKAYSAKKYAWVLAIILAMTIFILPPNTQAATEEEIEASVQKGLTWLVGQQQSNGAWTDYGRNAIACTGFAVLKLSERAMELNKNPYDDNPASPTYYEYAGNVIKGLNYLFNNAVYDALGQKVKWASDAWHYNYDTSIVMMGISAGKQPTRTVGVGPLTGLTYQQVMQYALNYLVSIQEANGGWGYPSPGWTDNSNTGYTALGLTYAQAFGLSIPAATLPGLSGYIDYIQNEVNGDTNDGGSGYTDPNSWVNILKTGNLLFEMALVGDTMTAIRAQDALDYIERHWNDYNLDPGWKGSGYPHLQACYGMMKGLVSMGIEEIDTGSGPFDWFDEVSTAIIAVQQADGSWPYDYWAGQTLATMWALLTLEKTVEIPFIPVFFDIRPTSCPNPFNFRVKGVLPAAILGTDELDVTRIDPASLRLILANGNTNGTEVAPLRWAWEDVAAPYVDGEECGCTTAGPDGYMDLTVKFDNQAVAGMFTAEVGDVVKLAITGNLKEEFGGTPIRGQDCVVVRK
jgi:hypothetical protein